MGKVIKKIMGDYKSHPKYDSLVIEQNADGKVHIHLKNIRMELTLKTYNQFYDIIKTVNDRLDQN